VLAIIYLNRLMATCPWLSMDSLSIHRLVLARYAATTIVASLTFAVFGINRLVLTPQAACYVRPSTGMMGAAPMAPGPVSAEVGSGHGLVVFSGLSSLPCCFCGSLVLVTLPPLLLSWAHSRLRRACVCMPVDCRELNRLERCFLDLIGFHLTVTPNEFAQTYLLLCVAPELHQDCRAACGALKTPYLLSKQWLAEVPIK